MSWPKKSLVDVADFQLGKMLDQVKNRGDSRPYLANKNVRWGCFDLSELREMRFEESELERFSLKNGDIVMCEGGEPGRCAIWADEMPNMMFQKALHRIRPLEEMNSVFLYYNLSHRARSGHFNGLFTGATIKHLPREKLALVQVDVPDLPTQKRIASILSAYDDLIENNRRRIALLEQAARLLYREWFVHLRFPGHETAKIVDGLPEGWESKRLSAVTTKLGSGATPKGGESAYEQSGVTLIRSLNVYDYSFHDDGLVFLNDDQAKKLANVTVESGDVLLNITGASVARCCIVPDRHLPARVNQHVMIIRVAPEQASPHFVLHAINSHQNKERLLSIARAGGATREALTKDTMAGFQIVFPSARLIGDFHEKCSSMHEQAEKISEQIALLTRARDLLLPRLMDGRIPV